MAQDYAASVSGTHIRITRLDASGAPLVGLKNSYVTKAFVSLSMSPEFEDGDEFTRKTASGEVCISVKTPDTLKRVTLSISLCNPDPEFTQMLSGGVLLSDGSQNTVGWLAPETGVDPTPTGVAIEVWSKAMLNGKPAPTDPYYHWLVPYAVMRLSGEQVIQNDILETSFEGWGVGNAAFQDGPAVPFWPWQSDRAYGYTRTALVPTGTGFQAVTADTPIIPTITSVVGTPNPAGTGQLVTITGTSFAAATAVTIGGTAATDYTIISATRIDAVMPSGAAGSVSVIVTNAAGASAPFAYTRAA